MNCNILSDNEKAILDKVIKKFKNYTSKEIVEYMHQETAYTKTVSGEVIPYSFSKELKHAAGYPAAFVLPVKPFFLSFKNPAY